MTRRSLLTLLLAASLSWGAAIPESVYVTDHGKTYHSRPNCMALSRAKQTYKTSVKQAEAHGLKPCGICNRPAAAPKKQGNSAWAGRDGK